MDVCPHLSVLCFSAYVEAVHQVNPPSKKPYQISKGFIISEVIMNWNDTKDTCNSRKIRTLPNTEIS
jgi:hypothetical protein